MGCKGIQLCRGQYAPKGHRHSARRCFSLTCTKWRPSSLKFDFSMLQVCIKFHQLILQSNSRAGVGKFLLANLRAPLWVSVLDLSHVTWTISSWVFAQKEPSIQIVYSAGSLDELGPSCIYFTRGFFGEAAASISKAMSGVSIPEPFKSQTPEDQQIKWLRCFENSLKRWSKWQSDA